MWVTFKLLDVKISIMLRSKQDEIIINDDMKMSALWNKFSLFGCSKRFSYTWFRIGMEYQFRYTFSSLSFSLWHLIINFIKINSENRPQHCKCECMMGKLWWKDWYENWIKYTRRVNLENEEDNDIYIYVREYIYFSKLVIFVKT